MGWNVQNRVFSWAFQTRSVFATHAVAGDAVGLSAATETAYCFPMIDGAVQGGRARRVDGQRMRLTGARWVSSPAFTTFLASAAAVDQSFWLGWESMYAQVFVYKGDAVPTNPGFTTQANRDYLCHLAPGSSEVIDYELEGGIAWVGALTLTTGMYSSALKADFAPVWSGSKPMFTGILTIDGVLL